MTLKVITRKVDDLIPYINNARIHNDNQVTQIASSIKEFGWTTPILIDGDNGIIAGHGRLMAAKKLGMKEVPVIELAHLSDIQKKALILADNKIALNSEWDKELVALELDALKDADFDIELAGFELKDLSMGDFDPASEDDQGKLDSLDPKWIVCPHCGTEFDMRANK